MTALKSFFELPKWTFTLGAILLMFWTMAGCVSSKGDVPDYLSEQSKNPPLMTECQLLLSEVEVVEQGIARRRRLYPLSSRLRLSEQAAMNGFNAATRKEAMIFFNQAWRFNPENPMAFWGAGIVRGCEALKYCEENNFDIARKCWDDCIKLFEICAQMLNHVPPLTKAEFQIDQAQTYISYVASMGDYLGGHDKALLEKAEALVLQYHNCTLFRPEENRLINARVAFQLWEIYTALGKCEEAEKYKEEAEIFKREFGGEKRTWGE